MNSIVSYPDRGKYGSSNYRGNTSGYIIRDLITHLKPRLFVDACEGGGTSRAVCAEMKVGYVGLDLHSGFDFTRQAIASKLERPADTCFTHPPYHDMIDYHKERAKHGKVSPLAPDQINDLSQCTSVDQFIEMSQLMILNQREATKPGGHYCTLIGDMRKNGLFHSFQADFIKMMPKSELVSVVIKAQHNTQSGLKTYHSNSFVPIMHEYLLLWKRSSRMLAQICWDKASGLQSDIQMTWRNYIRMALINLGGQSNLPMIYEEVLKIAGARTGTNNHVQAKIRQILQKHFVNVSRGVWAMN
jgi:hypothetical protein